MKRVKGEGVWLSEREYRGAMIYLIGMLFAMIGLVIAVVYIRFFIEASRPIPAVYENGEATAYYVEINRGTADDTKIYGGWIPLLENDEEAEFVRANGFQPATPTP